MIAYIEQEIAEMNKRKSCKDCIDRFVGCHSMCEYYIERSKKREEERTKRLYAFDTFYDPLLYNRKARNLNNKLNGRG